MLSERSDSSDIEMKGAFIPYYMQEISLSFVILSSIRDMSSTSILFNIIGNYRLVGVISLNLIFCFNWLHVFYPRTHLERWCRSCKRVGTTSCAINPWAIYAATLGYKSKNKELAVSVKIVSFFNSSS